MCHKEVNRYKGKKQKNKHACMHALTSGVESEEERRGEGGRK